jgi:hypothetical protein
VPENRVAPPFSATCSHTGSIAVSTTGPCAAAAAGGGALVIAATSGDAERQYQRERRQERLDLHHLLLSLHVESEARNGGPRSCYRPVAVL